jgi:hypothetical protein
LWGAREYKRLCVLGRIAGEKKITPGLLARVINYFGR